MDVSYQEFETFLEDISSCFLTRDFEAWQRRIILPFSIVTRDGPVVLDTDAELAANFQSYIVACEAMGLTLISRRIISLEDCGDGTWLGTYETRLIADGQLATRPYVSTALLSWDGTTLKMTSILNGRGHHEWTGQRPRG